MPACAQCGKLAVARSGDVLLCVDCALKLQQALAMQESREASRINWLFEQAEATVGMPGLLPRYRVPQPVVVASPTFNNIQIDRSIIGVINTGYAQKIDATLSHIRTGGDDELAQALQMLTQAVVDSPDLPIDAKNAALEHLAFVSDQATAPPDKRQKSIGKAVLGALGQLLQNAAALITLWNQFQPALMRLFQ